MTSARLAHVDAARLRHAGRRARSSRRRPTPPGSSALRERAERRGYDRLVVYADREHSANLALPDRLRPALRGGGARRWGRRATPAILVGNECWGMAGAAPLPMRRDLLPGPQPARASRATGRGRCARSSRGEGIGRGPPRRRRRLEDVREPRHDRGCRPTSSTSCATLVGPSGLVENANDLLIDPADGLRVINEVEQLAAFEYAACQTSNGVRQRADRAAPGHDRAGGRPAARLERLAAVVPPDAHRRAAGDARAAQPGRPADRARRPVHDRLRDLGRAQLPRRLRRRGRRRSCRTGSATTSSGSSPRTSRPSPSGTGRCTSARPAGRSRRSSTATSATRSSGSSSTPGTSSTSTSG